VNDLSPADFSVKPTLVGEKVLLRPFLLEQDLPVLRPVIQDPEVGRLTGSPVAQSWDHEAEDGFVTWYSTRHEQRDRLDLAVIDQATGACVGEVVLNQWDAGNRSCNFRILLAAAGRDRGLGTEATRLIVDYGFERLGLHRISLGVFSFNPRARRAYEKAGFVVEGVLRDAYLCDGVWVDDIVMSILAPEWEIHRGRPQGPNSVS
jgi:RimJ/RimL family protein N-acetyltransferase